MQKNNPLTIMAITAILLTAGCVNNPPGQVHVEDLTATTTEHNVVLRMNLANPGPAVDDTLTVTFEGPSPCVRTIPVHRSAQSDTEFVFALPLSGFESGAYTVTVASSMSAACASLEIRAEAS
ncbi:MAG: hypothetical protein A4E28_02421 [Methanocella sp. PtaU1.Bin125]|nr:MAG: hypothetical protein A4E28_02421 [Methanocella sp. PtaU1.Bin125]